MPIRVKAHEKNDLVIFKEVKILTHDKVLVI
jgi:hypothetical protein